MRDKDTRLIYEAMGDGAAYHGGTPKDFPKNSEVRKWLLDKGFRYSVIDRDHDFLEWRYIKESPSQVPHPYHPDTKDPVAEAFMTVTPEFGTNKLPYRISIVHRDRNNPGGYVTGQKSHYWDVIAIPNTRQLDAAWEKWTDLLRTIEKEQMSDWTFEEGYSLFDTLRLPQEVEEYLEGLGFEANERINTTRFNIIEYKLEEGEIVKPLYANSRHQYAIWFSIDPMSVSPKNQSIQGKYYVLDEYGSTIDNPGINGLTQISSDNWKKEIDDFILQYKNTIKVSDKLSDWDF